MTVNCRKTCGFCVSDTCTDGSAYRVQCPAWKRDGHCRSSTEYSSFMKHNCKKTCGFCVSQPGGVAPPTASPATVAPKSVKGCTNTPRYSANCNAWKRMGHCQIGNDWYSFMKDHCKKTCNFCLQADCGLTGGRQGRIVGGVNAAPNRWKWQAAILQAGKFVCGGSLIARQWVLTVAHCTESLKHRARAWRVVLGEHDRRKKEGTEVKMQVEKIINHKDYNSQTMKNDIALIKLKKPAPLNDKIGLVCLPKAGEQVKVGKKCYVSGWGNMNHTGSSVPILQQAAMPIVAQSTCKRRNFFGISKGEVCAGYGPSSIISGCKGDSGGPLVCENENYRYVLEGAVSWASQSCNSKEMYTVFVRISEYINWINANMK